MSRCVACSHPTSAHRTAVTRRPGPCAVCGCERCEHGQPLHGECEECEWAQALADDQATDEDWFP